MTQMSAELSFKIKADKFSFLALKILIRLIPNNYTPHYYSYGIAFSHSHGYLPDSRGVGSSEWDCFMRHCGAGKEAIELAGATASVAL